jgi:cytochrome P450
VTTDAIVDLTVHGEHFTADPYPVYARLRALGPLHRVRTDSGVEWLVVGYDEARAALADPRLGKDWRLLFPDHDPIGVDGHLLDTDPPDHTRLRRLVTREFTARRMEALRPRIQQITTELLDTMLPLGTADLIEALAFPLPITVICELLGVPDLDREAFRDWSHTIIDKGDGEAAAIRGMSGYLAGLIEDKRKGEPRDDLLSALVRASDEDGDRLSAQELVGMAFLLLVAGHETTVNLIGNGTLALLRHPGQLADLRADLGLLDGAIEEMLRYEGPLRNATYRFTREPVEIGGLTIPAGEPVVVALSAGNRDGNRYPRPDTFDIRRVAQGHLAFGHGIHFCLGAPLARVEAQVAFTELLTRAPELALADEPLSWRPGPLMRGVHRLPVTF